MRRKKHGLTPVHTGPVPVQNENPIALLGSGIVAIIAAACVVVFGLVGAVCLYLSSEDKSASRAWQPRT